MNLRLNEAIRVPEVRLINAKGENIGVVTIEEALRMAREAELDLVEIAPAATPPVCKITDIGKLLYERTKKEKEARKAQTKIEVKEIRLRPKTNEHHRSFKTRDARKWLLAGMKVRVTVRFRGREITYPDLALEDLREIAEELKDVCVIEQTPAMEGRSMTMMLGPSKAKHVKVAPTAKPEEESPAAPVAIPDGQALPAPAESPAEKEPAK
ncbi:MAG: translation initiation factor IF-3 [Anaerolineaceae bacterium]